MKKAASLLFVSLLAITILGSSSPALAIVPETSKSYDSLARENRELKELVAKLMQQIAVFKAGTTDPSYTGRDTLYVYPNNSNAIKFKNINSATANALCATLGGGAYTKTSSCTYANKTLSNPSGIGYKEGGNPLKFIAPRSGQNDTISLNSERYTFIIRDTAATKATAAVGKYRIFGFYFSPNRYDRVNRIYEFDITSTRTSGNKIYLESDLTVDGGSTKPTPGNYYFYAVNAETGDAVNVSAFTYITAATSPVPTPVGPQRKTAYCSANFNLKPIWGTVIYTDDSDVCTAAAHVGVILRSTGGTVSYTTTKGQSSYIASTRNNIQSGAWDAWSGSFVFDGNIINLNTAPSISVTGPLSGQTITIGNPIPVKWSYTNIPKNSQIVTTVEIIENGVASPDSTWQSPEISGTGTYTYPGGWKTSAGQFSTPGTYRITSNVRKCGEAGCNFYYPEYDSISPSALGTPVEFKLKD